MAYNKSKFVESAQKLLNQGKVAQAIAEYQQILKYEPKDQVTLMTIGELYIRQGETFQAIDYFERLAQIFVGDGFLTKAIAVYKRIAKLAPEEIRPLERLADLYVQQGVMSEARPLFLQLAEIHLKNNRQPEAVSLLKKLLLAEPDNIRIQIRLADLYQAMGQNTEAIEAYVSAAQRALARADHAECEKLADKALKLDPANFAAITVKARSYSAQGNLQKAAEVLKELPGLEKGGEQAEFLLDLYIKADEWEDATSLALKVFEADEKNFTLVQKVAEAELESGQADRAMKLISKLRIPMIDAGEHDVISQLLNTLAARMPGRLEPREWLVDTYGRMSDSFRLPDALAQLGDALVAAKNYPRAKEIFEQLVDRQPESDSAKRKLNGVLVKMGLAQPEAGAPDAFETLQAEIPQPDAPKVRLHAAGVIEEEPNAVGSAPISSFMEEPIDDETQKFIAQSLTDVDLFASYGLTQKAIGLLEAILRRAPRHTPTLEKLLDFVLGAGDDRRTAELAAQLEQIHKDRGETAGAERFGELRRRFQRAAGISDEELLAASASQEVAAEPETVAEVSVHTEETDIPVAEVEPEVVAAAPVPSAAPEVQEVDLSDEWSSMLQEAAPEPSAPALPSIEEIAPVHPPAPKAPPSAPVADESLAEFEIPLEPVIDSPSGAKSSFEDLSAELASAPPPAPQADDEPVAMSFEEKPAAAPPPPPPPPAPAKPKAAQAPPPKQPEPELELEQDYELVLAPEPLVPAFDQKPPDTRAPAAMSADQFLSDMASELDEMGIDKLAPAPSKTPAPASAAPAPPAPSAKPPQAPAAPPVQQPVESGPLQEVFDEFRAELGEMGGEEEDLETHYNLGIAFREMGLLEEAISEFQKVAKATDRGKAFRYAMQCCTLLGLAFMEKGQPNIAAIWYERALHTPGVDAESTLALRYDLGVAQESAGDIEGALKSFSQVYAANIDYRDVADRIASLQKPAR
ncbi:MAG: tetratricopeptide repeat protein [Acidobacteria bacterium]|nr:tetratricopeptide repeat protein [Acidobacteriota bacterium]MBS1866396.1 tetratricopeptide repeat protein [Acidobacteriota bacterium]